MNSVEFQTIRQAIQQTRELRSTLGHNAEVLAQCLNEPGVLQQVGHYELRKLKRALQRYNSATGRWAK